MLGVYVTLLLMMIHFLVSYFHVLGCRCSVDAISVDIVVLLSLVFWSLMSVARRPLLKLGFHMVNIEHGSRYTTKREHIGI